MPIQLFTNNATSTLNGAITSGATSITVATGEGARFPAPTGGDWFIATMFQKSAGLEVNHEIVKCTARSGDVLTVVRAQEGTSARAFNSAEAIELRMTAGAMGGKVDKASNLSDLANAATARTNLGLVAVAATGAKADVGLGNVDNTADAAKPVSTAQATAIAAKQDASAKDASGGYAGLTLFKLNMRNVANTFTSWLTNTNTAARTYTLQNRDGTLADDTDLSLKAPLASPAFTGTVTGITKTMVGLGNADDTTDAGKPVSTAQATAIALKLDKSGGSMSGDITMANNDVATLKTATFNGEYDAGNSGSAITIDFANGQNQRVTLNAATPTITISAPPGTGHWQLTLIQDGSGGRVPSFSGPATTIYLGSVGLPGINTAASGKSLWNGYWNGSAWTAATYAKIGAV